MVMGRPSKGDRSEVRARVPAEVKKELLRLQSAHGIRSESQLVADLLSQVVGRPDLMRELRNSGELSMTA